MNTPSADGILKDTGDILAPLNQSIVSAEVSVELLADQTTIAHRSGCTPPPSLKGRHVLRSDLTHPQVPGSRHSCANSRGMLSQRPRSDPPSRRRFSSAQRIIRSGQHDPSVMSSRDET